MKLKQISKVRGKKRQQLLKSICITFVSEMLFYNKPTFTREDLKRFFSDCNKTPKRTQQAIIKSVLDYLLKEKKIIKTAQKKSVKFWRNQDLTSQDYGSFKVLMEKNGYKKTKELKPTETETDYLTEVIGFNIEEIEPVYLWKSSFKDRNKQGCFSNGNLSLRLATRTYKTDCYKIIV